MTSELIAQQWNKTESETSIIYTNKKDSALTVEMHQDYESELGDIGEGDYKFWYMFPARNGIGIPNCPTVISESGGYTKEDAIKELEKLVIESSEVKS